MTVVQLLFRQLNAVTGAYDPVTAPEARVLIAPVRRIDSAAGEVLPVATTALVGASVTVPPGTYRFILSKFPDGRGGYLTGADADQIREVPGVGGPYQVDDLVEVSISGGVALLPEWKVYVDQQIATVAGGVPVSGSGPGGALQPIDLYAVTALGQSLITAGGVDDTAKKTAMRAVIAAGTSSLATGITSTTAKAGDYQPTIAQIVGTGTAGRAILAAETQADALTAAGAAAVGHTHDADLFLDVPKIIREGSAAYTNRPATPRDCHFYGTVPPSNDGSTSGGGGMVPTKDSWYELVAS